MNTTQHKGLVIWFTGLSGSGKSTIANRLADLLTAQKLHVQRLDGNLLKGCFGKSLDQDKVIDHHYNVQLAAFTASLLEKHGVIVIASFISPQKAERDIIREQCKNVIEVYIETPLDVCIERDTKGFYKKLQTDEITSFPGYTSTYEVPEDPAITIHTTEMDVETAAQTILKYLKENEVF
jgi:adenylylsulfate kinase